MTLPPQHTQACEIVERAYDLLSRWGAIAFREKKRKNNENSVLTLYLKAIQVYTKAMLHTQASPPLAPRTFLYILLQGQCGQRHIYLNNGGWFSWRLLAISAITKNLKAFIIKGTNSAEMAQQVKLHPKLCYSPSWFDHQNPQPKHMINSYKFSCDNDTCAMAYACTHSHAQITHTHTTTTITNNKLKQ